jgi:hypothetical protein
LIGIGAPKINHEEEKVQVKEEQKEELKVKDKLKEKGQKVPPKVPITFRACKSLLLTDKGHQVVFEGLRGKAIALELLMRGSEHGFTKEEF